MIKETDWLRKFHMNKLYFGIIAVRIAKETASG